ncbi:hypothetical protein DEA8626_03508 [Defluviimonas aquaemixtae]|uniref:PNPLA domain-containing protein n=1 Tax=Albidovulum aquaemixtae TaxID=1542388 RepID=A0A2R8BM21_9RHOB|nr:patatin-like phospholipase family protein [Defluviimonas aquaemixtae]SPH24456.1 hypothetical protein DEA8626_03508 [Defluviimonas aquaemixtae]
MTFTNQQVDTGPGKGMAHIALKDVALATSAAPSCFPPHQIVAQEGGAAVNYGFFADGGTFANNPIMNAIEVALANNKISSSHETSAISIGIGDMPIGVPGTAVGDPLQWGFFEWIGLGSKAPYAALLELSLGLSAGNDTRIAGAILGQNIVRLNPKLSQSVALDGRTADDYKVMLDAVQPWIDYDPSRDAGNPDLEVWRRALALVNGW